MVPNDTARVDGYVRVPGVTPFVVCWKTYWWAERRSPMFGRINHERLFSRQPWWALHIVEVAFQFGLPDRYINARPIGGRILLYSSVPFPHSRIERVCIHVCSKTLPQL